MAAAPAEKDLLPDRDFDFRVGAAHHRDDEWARARRARSNSSCSGLASGNSLLKRRCDRLAGGEPRIALEHDEAPGHELAMVRHARGDRDEGVDLSRGRAGARKLKGL